MLPADAPVLRDEDELHVAASARFANLGITLSFDRVFAKDPKAQGLLLACYINDILAALTLSVKPLHRHSPTERPIGLHEIPA
jgi:hypothetical protein